MDSEIWERSQTADADAGAFGNEKEEAGTKTAVRTVSEGDQYAAWELAQLTHVATHEPMEAD